MPIGQDNDSGQSRVSAAPSVSPAAAQLPTDMGPGEPAGQIIRQTL
ncbi:hypothetical protein N008_04095 [Hymenobacter sp. APR13]|nr:hypothetical protein N008_04095 [Hymenobacter sp. APR13]